MRRWRYIHNHETEGEINAKNSIEAKAKADALTDHREWGPWRSTGDGDWIKESGDNFVLLIYEGKLTDLETLLSGEGEPLPSFDATKERVTK